MKKTFRLFSITAVTFLLCGGLFAVPAAKPAPAVKHPAAPAKRAEVRKDAVRRATTVRPRYGAARYYYWYDLDDGCHHDYVKNANCVLKVRKKLSESSGIFEVKSSVGSVSVERSAQKAGVDYTLHEKELIRIDGIDMEKRKSGDTLYLPSCKNLWYSGEFRDAHGKVSKCYSLNAEDAETFKTMEK